MEENMRERQLAVVRRMHQEFLEHLDRDTADLTPGTPLHAEAKALRRIGIATFESVEDFVKVADDEPKAAVQLALTGLTSAFAVMMARVVAFSTRDGRREAGAKRVCEKLTASIVALARSSDGENLSDVFAEMKAKLQGRLN